jgi:hypothetical protein
VFQIDYLAIFQWGTITFGVMLAVALTYGATKKMLKPATSPPSQMTSTPSLMTPTPSPMPSGKEYFVTIDTNAAMLFYNQAKSEYEMMNYKSSISNCYSSMKEVFLKILNYLNIRFPDDLNIVDMSFLIISKGISLSFLETVQHMNSIRLRSIIDQPVSKEEVLWMLTASKIIIDSCKELPVNV